MSSPTPTTADVAGACTLSPSIEKKAVAYGDAHTVLSMISLTAPAALGVQRPPIDLIPCVDRSGSMGGRKMALMKHTLKMLIARAGLNAADRLGIVSFDNHVKEELPLVSMDSQGRAKADAVVDALEVGGTTNLSGGLLKSIDMLSSADAAAGRTRCVLLFTDGIANEGVRDTPTLVSAVQGATGSTAMTLFTFGFGDDHAEDMLRSIAEPSSGLYYFISSVEAIPTAFADCLGGIMSVVAQNASLTLEAAAGHEISKVLGGYTVKKSEGTKTTIELGDLYAEDEKDLLFELRLPALGEAKQQSGVVVHAKLRYFSVGSKKMEEVSTQVLVSRPSTTPSDQSVNIKLDEQRNRMRAAEAMEEAARLADGGDLEAGRALLQSTRSMMSESLSAATPLSRTLARECDLLSHNYADMPSYRSLGRKQSAMSAHSHKLQRSTHTSEDVYRGGSVSKVSMKSSWGLPESSKAIKKQPSNHHS